MTRSNATPKATPKATPNTPARDRRPDPGSRRYQSSLAAYEGEHAWWTAAEIADVDPKQSLPVTIRSPGSKEARQFSYEIYKPFWKIQVNAVRRQLEGDLAPVLARLRGEVAARVETIAASASAAIPRAVAVAPPVCAAIQLPPPGPASPSTSPATPPSLLIAARAQRLAAAQAARATNLAAVDAVLVAAASLLSAAQQCRGIGPSHWARWRALHANIPYQGGDDLTQAASALLSSLGHVMGLSDDAEFWAAAGQLHGKQYVADRGREICRALKKATQLRR